MSEQILQDGWSGKFTLTNIADSKNKTTDGRIRITSESIAITLDGYGDYSSEDGLGFPVLIERVLAACLTYGKLLVF